MDDGKRINAELILDRLAEMQAIAERLPEPERTRAQEMVARIRRDLQPILDALKPRH